MNVNISMLIEAAKAVHMDATQRAEQRSSFVYGNTKIENEKITRDLVDRIAEDVPEPTPDLGRSDRRG